MLGFALCAGCAISPAEEAARREALAAEGKALENAADLVEARLLAGEARLAVWKELAARQRSVTEVACRVGDVHFQDMARLFEEQAEKGRGRRRTPAWASAGSAAPGVGGPRVPLVDEQ